MVVNILGTDYEIIYDTLANDKKYECCSGYCDKYTKRIHIRKHTPEDADIEEMTIDDNGMRIYENKTLRHELVHAFLYESGLDVNTNDVISWSTNEEMVDWMAIQMPKIMDIYDSIANEVIIESRYIHDKRSRIIRK